MTPTADYLLIGHVAHDETPQGPKLGGTVSYSGGAANALGAQVAIVTSAQKGEGVLKSLPPEIQGHLIEAPERTVFYNIYEGEVRRQVMPHRAAPTVPVVDATGAGDVFAGTFVVVYQRTHDVRRAAEVACQVASLSVTRMGLDGIPKPEEIGKILG